MAVGAETRELLEEQHDIPTDRVVTVAQLAHMIDGALNQPDLRAAHVIGEVSNTRDWKGNCFFTIKDREAKLSCVLFSRNIDDYRPEEGDRVLVRGEVDFYHDKGSLSLKANTAIPLGEGEYYRKLQELKKELRDDGLFDQQQEPPRLPDTVGLITGRDADALTDVRDSLWDRNPGTAIRLHPASVQGEDAEEELVDALERLDRLDLDTIIIARGGGDIEALKPFNTRTIAEAINDTKTPVITGIGHREDETIAGLAADVRGITPTDAGRKATDDLTTVVDDLQKMETTIKEAYNAYNRQKEQEETLQAKERRERLYQAAIIGLTFLMLLLWWSV